MSKEENKKCYSGNRKKQTKWIQNLINDDRPLAVFIDFDGVCIKHKGNLGKMMEAPLLLPGVREKFDEWYFKGYKIIITTGRPESMRNRTIEQIEELGLFYDYLLMGLGGGARVIFNDKKPNNDNPTAYAFSLHRDEGLANVNI
jgi:phosphoglycolate phosphatase-like HAD superfamily hydrolase